MADDSEATPAKRLDSVKAKTRSVVGDKPAAHEEQFTALATRLAQGAAVVSGLLAFLGVSQGQLDRLLRNNPGEAMRYFALVGVGIVMGIAVLSFQVVTRRFALITLALLAVGLGGPMVSSWLHGEHPFVAGVALFLGIAAGVVLIPLVAWSLPGRGLVLIVGVLVFVVGVAGIAVLSVRSKAAKDRPRIEAALEHTEQGWVIGGKVAAQGLNSAESVYIEVTGVNRTVPLSASGRGRGSGFDDDVRKGANGYVQTILYTRVGPDNDGKIDVPIAVPISPGLYERVVVSVSLESERVRALALAESTLYDRYYQALDAAGGDQTAPAVEEAGANIDMFYLDHPDQSGDECSSVRQDASCVAITMPQGSRRPTLDLTLGSGTVTVTAAADDLNPLDVVVVQVATPAGVQLYDARLSAGPTGALERSATIAVAPGSEVCALARIERPPPPGEFYAPESEPEQAYANPPAPLMPPCAEQDDPDVATARLHA